jgi:uncharacterized protein with PIN domain
MGDRHYCLVPNPRGHAYRNIIRCDHCGSFWIVKDGWRGRTWRPVSRFLAWRLRRQLALEGGKK